MIGKKATVDVPGQRGANITMCSAISTDGLLLHKPLIGPYKTKRLFAFLHDLYGRVVDAMNAGCLDIPAQDCQGWIRHARRFFPRCNNLDDKM